MSLDLEMEEIHKIFFEESFEGLDVMESGLLALDATADRETINTIFRAAHSIKGGAGTFGLMEISGFTHGVETLLDQMRDGKRPVTAEAVQVLLQAVDVLRGMIDAAQGDQPVPMAAAQSTGAQIDRMLGGGPPGASVPAGQSRADGGLRIRFKPHSSLFRTCNDPLRIFAQLESMSTLHSTVHCDGLPSLADMDPMDCYLAWTLTLDGAVSEASARD